MFNSKQHDLRLARSRKQAPPDADFLMRLVVDDCMERLTAVSRTFDHAIALFGRTPYLYDCMSRSDQIHEVQRVEEVHPWGIADKITNPLDFGLKPNSTDLIIAPLTLHWSNDLPGSLIQLQHALRPDGLLLAVLPGPDTLVELRSSLIAAESNVRGGAALRVDPFTDIREAGALLQRCGFALPVVDQEVSTVRYDNALKLISDLRAFGATRQVSEQTKPLNRTIIAQLLAHYSENHADDDGRVRASFSFVSLSGWVPHSSQQKPLKPGSASMRLADVLNTNETKIKG